MDDEATAWSLEWVGFEARRAEAQRRIGIYEPHLWEALAVIEAVVAETPELADPVELDACRAILAETSIVVAESVQAAQRDDRDALGPAALQTKADETRRLEERAAKLKHCAEVLGRIGWAARPRRGSPAEGTLHRGLKALLRRHRKARELERHLALAWIERRLDALGARTEAPEPAAEIARLEAERERLQRLGVPDLCLERAPFEEAYRDGLAR